MCYFLTGEGWERGSAESWKLGHFAFHWALLSHFHIVHLSFQSIFHSLRCTPPPPPPSNSCLKPTSCISNFRFSPPCDFAAAAGAVTSEAALETQR